MKPHQQVGEKVSRFPLGSFQAAVLLPVIACCTNIAFFSISFEAPITCERFTRTGPERGGLLRT